MTPRRARPSGRALLGGLLISLAALGTFNAHQAAQDGPSGHFLLASADLDVGHPIDPSDLIVAPMDLPEQVAAAAFADPAELAGAVVLAPLRAGELLQASAIRLDGDTGADLSPHEISLSIPADRALNGHLQRGEVVEILATFGTGDAARTRLVARDATVVRVERDGDAIGTAGALVLTFALVEDEDVIALAHAARVGELTIVRSTGAVLGTEPGSPGGGSTPDAAGHGAGPHTAPVPAEPGGS